MIPKKQNSLKDVLQELMQNPLYRTKYNEARIREVWEEAMGPVAARYTESVKLKAQTLTVTLTSAPLRQDLSFRRAEIIVLINEKMGEEVVRSLEIF